MTGVQTCALPISLIPGVSRSGITISTALFRNVDRAAATRFSFLLSTPIIVGASLLEGMHFDRGDRTALIPHFGACTARVAALEAVGPIAEDMPNYEDYDWFLRVRECGVTMVSHDRVSLHRRMHHGSTSQRRPASQAELLGALQRSLRRRRGSGSMLALPRLSDLGDRGAS